jgi:hypothetical protein
MRNSYRRHKSSQRGSGLGIDPTAIRKNVTDFFANLWTKPSVMPPKSFGSSPRPIGPSQYPSNERIKKNEVGLSNHKNECIVYPAVRCDRDKNSVGEYISRFVAEYDDDFLMNANMSNKKDILKTMYTIVTPRKNGIAIQMNDDEVAKGLVILDPDRKHVVHTPIDFCNIPLVENIWDRCDLLKSLRDKMPYENTDERLVGISFAIVPRSENYFGLLDSLSNSAIPAEEKIRKIASVLLQVTNAVRVLHQGHLSAETTSSIVHTQITPDLIHINGDDVVLKTHPKSMYIDSLVRTKTFFTLDADDLLDPLNYQYPPEAILALLALLAIPVKYQVPKNFDKNEGAKKTELLNQLRIDNLRIINEKKALFVKAKNALLDPKWRASKLHYSIMNYRGISDKEKFIDMNRTPVKNNLLKEYKDMMNALLGPIPIDDIDHMFNKLKQSQRSGLVSLVVKLTKLIDEYQLLLLIAHTIETLAIGHVTRTFMILGKQKTMTINEYLIKYLPRRKATINQIETVLTGMLTTVDPVEREIFYSATESLNPTGMGSRISPFGPGRTRRVRGRLSRGRLSRSISLKSMTSDSYDPLTGRRKILKSKTRSKTPDGYVKAKLTSKEKKDIEKKLKDDEDERLYGEAARKYLGVKDNKWENVARKYLGWKEKVPTWNVGRAAAVPGKMKTILIQQNKGIKVNDIDKRFPGRVKPVF